MGTAWTSEPVRGHGLLAEGEGHIEVNGTTGYFSETDDGRKWRLRSSGAEREISVGLCRCGAVSPPGLSNNGRKRWHREHKAAVIAAREEST